MLNQEIQNLDLNGFDAFAKVRILSALAFNSKISKSQMFNGRD